MKKKLLCRLVATMIFTAFSLHAIADGDQRQGDGTRWVDPVGFFKLQDINRTDFQRDYDQGDIDFNKVLAKKGIKVYGLNLKPVAAAGIPEKYGSMFGKSHNVEFDYQNVFGITGVPLHEAGFCVYVDEGVTRTYDFDYTIKSLTTNSNTNIDENIKIKSNYTIKQLTMVPKEDGIAFSYGFSAEDKIDVFTSKTRSGVTRTTVEEYEMKGTKSVGVNGKFARFIYHKEGNRLFLMIGSNLTLMKRGNSIGTVKGEHAEKVWFRVYFEVEQVQIDAKLAADYEGTTLQSHETDTPTGLDGEDKTDLINFVSNLVSWLKGEGDPLGLGKHTDEMGSAVVNTIGTVMSLLLGTGIASVAGSSGAEIVGGLTSTLTSGGTTPPPYTPDIPDMDGLSGRRPKDEREGDEDGTAPPVPGEEPPTIPGEPEATTTNEVLKNVDNPAFFQQHVTIDSDGDLVVKDPITGQDTIYTDNGDGTFKNLTTDQSWTPKEIEDRLIYKTENKTLLQKDAETAKENLKKFKEDIEKNKGYSREAEEYKKEKEKLQAELDYFDKMNKLAKKYNTVYIEGQDKELKDYVKKIVGANQAKDMANAAKEIANAKFYDKAIVVADIVDKGIDASLYIAGKCVPGGEYVYDGYAIAKNVLVASEEARNGFAKGSWTSHVGAGLVKGLAAVTQNHAAYLAGEGKWAVAKKFVYFTGSEAISGGVTAWDKGENVIAGAVSGFEKKAAAFVTSAIVGDGLKGLGKNSWVNLTRLKGTTTPVVVDPLGETIKKADVWTWNTVISTMAAKGTGTSIYVGEEKTAGIYQSMFNSGKNLNYILGLSNNDADRLYADAELFRKLQESTKQ